jgi:hypothetical protein
VTPPETLILSCEGRPAALAGPSLRVAGGLDAVGEAGGAGAEAPNGGGGGGGTRSSLGGTVSMSSCAGGGGGGGGGTARGLLSTGGSMGRKLADPAPTVRTTCLPPE